MSETGNKPNTHILLQSRTKIRHSEQGIFSSRRLRSTLSSALLSSRRRGKPYLKKESRILRLQLLCELIVSLPNKAGCTAQCSYSVFTSWPPAYELPHNQTQVGYIFQSLVLSPFSLHHRVAFISGYQIQMSIQHVLCANFNQPLPTAHHLSRLSFLLQLLIQGFKVSQVCLHQVPHLSLFQVGVPSREPRLHCSRNWGWEGGSGDTAKGG